MKLGIFPESFVSPHENQKKEKKRKEIKIEIYLSD